MKTFMTLNATSLCLISCALVFFCFYTPFYDFDAPSKLLALNLTFDHNNTKKNSHITKKIRFETPVYVAETHFVNGNNNKNTNYTHNTNNNTSNINTYNTTTTTTNKNTTTTTINNNNTTTTTNNNNNTTATNKNKNTNNNNSNAITTTTITNNNNNNSRYITKNVLFKMPIYVAGAYLVDKKLLRVILITNCSQPMIIFASLAQGNHASKTIVQAKISVIDIACPSTTACIYGGFYGEFELPHNFAGTEITLRTRTNSVKISVQQTIPSNQRKHVLAVCFPVLFYYADFVQLIQILEHWLINGATKFFIYWQTFTLKVKQVIQFYQQSGVDIEIISWPHLSDPIADRQLFYSGQVVSINDCLHRARSQAQFTAVVDLDEFIATNVTILELIKKIKTDSAGINIKRKAAYHRYSNATNSTNLKYLSLAKLKNIDLQHSFEDSGKQILRPENVRRGSVHIVLESEKNKSQPLQILPDKAVFVHIRNAHGLRKKDSSMQSDILATISANITESWQRRLNSMNSSQITLLDIPENPGRCSQMIEMCLVNILAEHGRLCFTASNCLSLLKKYPIDWQTPRRMWIEL